MPRLGQPPGHDALELRTQRMVGQTLQPSPPCRQPTDPCLMPSDAYVVRDGEGCIGPIKRRLHALGLALAQWTAVTPCVTAKTGAAGDQCRLLRPAC